MNKLWMVLKQDVTAIWTGLRASTGNATYVLQGFVLYLAMTAVDFASSMGRWPEGFQESNPFARHMNGSFWPLHALLNCAVDTLGIGFLSGGLYAVGRAVDRRWAQFMAALPWLYYGYGHLAAALDNLQIKSGLYVHSLDEFFQILNRLLRH